MREGSLSWDGFELKFTIMDTTRLRLLRMKRLPVYRKFRYTVAPSDKLSRCLSALSHLSTAYEQDMELDGSGECGPLIRRSLAREAQRIAERHGFKDVEHVIRVTARRTAARRCGYPRNPINEIAFLIPE